MSDQIFVNIKSLPEIEQINSGDFMVVETPAGTSIIDFQNFVITPDNTTFLPYLSANSQNLDIAQNALNARIDSLSATVNQKFTSTYIGKTLITISTGRQNSGVLSPLPPTGISLNTNDVIVLPANNTAVLSGAYCSSINSQGLVTLSSPYSFISSAQFNVLVIKGH